VKPFHVIEVKALAERSIFIAELLWSHRDKCAL